MRFVTSVVFYFFHFYGVYLHCFLNFLFSGGGIAAQKSLGECIVEQLSLFDP